MAHPMKMRESHEMPRLSPFASTTPSATTAASEHSATTCAPMPWMGSVAHSTTQAAMISAIRLSLGDHGVFAGLAAPTWATLLSCSLPLAGAAPSLASALAPFMLAQSALVLALSSLSAASSARSLPGENIVMMAM